ncbi:MAG: efflux RND transporter permease subunit [Cyanobacteria bacterium]|nr:efflux RND transporter permease subunit [Cyanobacteriota bacterium]
MFDRLAPRFSISALSIRRHIATLAIAVAAIVMGAVFVADMSVDLLPSITYPRIGLRANAPGLAPDVAIDEVTRPLEEALSATEGVVQIYSQTREGSISLDLFFEPGGNLDQALNDATAAFNRARGRLPDVVEDARLFKFDPSQLPVYEFALTSPSLDSTALRTFADETLARELNVVAGVASVDVSGGLREEVNVLLDLERMQTAGVGLGDVLDKLEAENQDVSGGRLLGGGNEPLTRAMGRFRSAEELAQVSFPVGTIAAADEGAIATRRVDLAEVADIIDGSEEQQVSVYLDGLPAVKVSVQKQPDANTIAVVEAVTARIEQMRADGLIPAEADLIATLDESIFIRNAIANVISSGLIGTALAAIAVLLFLGSLRQTIIIVTAIPLATLMAVILMRFAGLSLNVFSLGGLALGVGIVVDNSIVMLETIVEGTAPTGDRHPDPEEIVDRAIASSQSVESALIASTSTNLVSVLPFLFIGGFLSLLFGELILTISFAVGASIVVAVTIVPVMASRLLAVRWRSGIHRLWPLQKFEAGVQVTAAAYRRMLRLALRYRLVVVGAVAALLLSSSATAIARIPQEILPSIATGQVELSAQFPPGTPLADNERVMERIDELLLAHPATASAFTTVGGSLFGSNVSQNSLRSRSTISLAPGSDPRRYITDIEQAIAELNLVDVRVRLRPGSVRGLILTNSPVRGADLDVILQGPANGTLPAAGRQVLEALDRQATTISFRPDAEDAQPEIQIRPDLDRLADLDLSIADVGRTLETAISGRVATQLQRGDRLVDVRVRLDRDRVDSPERIAELPLFATGNRPVTIGDVATLGLGTAPGEIQRINQRNVFILSGTLNEGANLSAAIAEVDGILAGLELPEGVSRIPSPAAASNQQVQTALPVLGGLAAFLVLVVLAVQYNSLIDPFIILFAVPLAVAGGILGLYVTQTAIGATVVVGAVLLVGIVVNNAIVLVELANQLRETHNLSRYEAILQASPQRLRPILMTTVTTVLGMLPLAMGQGEGGEFLQPLGIVVFSGLSLSTVLTLFIVPCLYLLLHSGLGSGRPPRDRGNAPTHRAYDDGLTTPEPLPAIALDDHPIQPSDA